MAFTVDNNTLNMVREQNVLIAGLPDADVRRMLENHSVPEARGRLLTATDSSGTHIFYGDLGDLTDPNVQLAAEQILDTVLDMPAVRGMFQRVVCAIAAARLVNNIASILKDERDWCEKTEKQAFTSLEYLIRSPLLKSAASAAAKKASSTVTPALLYMAVAPNLTTVNITDKTIQPYAGAQEAGTATLSIDGVLVSVPVAIGDTAVQVLRALSAAAGGMAQAGQINVSVGVNENSGLSQPWLHTYTYVDNLTGQTNTSTEPFAVATPVSSLEFYPRLYDGLRDVSVIQLYLSHPDPLDPVRMLPGISGLLIGDVPFYQNLTASGPYTVAVDLQQGRSISASTIQQTTPPSDMFFFQVSGYATPQPARATVTVAGSTDQGETVTLTIAGQDYSYTTQPTDTPDQVASALAALVTADAGTPVTAVATGTVLEVTAAQSGPTGNQIDISVVVTPSGATSNLTATASGAMLAGGASQRTTRADGMLNFRFEGLVAGGNGEFSVAIPAGSSAMDVVGLFGRELAGISNQTNVVAAIRPSSLITINGTDMSLPGMEFLAYAFEARNARIVLTVTQVPMDVTFAVVSPQLVPTSPVDAGIKSVVITTFQFKGTLRSGDSGTPIATGNGSVKAVPPVISDRLRKIFKDTGGSFR